MYCVDSVTVLDSYVWLVHCRRICIAGTHFGGPHDARAHKIAAAIAAKYPAQYETWFYWTGIDQWSDYVIQKFDKVPFPAELKGHSTHPFVWLETGADQQIVPIGGRDRLCLWAQKMFPAADSANADILKLADGSISMLDMWGHATDMPAATCGTKLQ